MEMSLAIRGWLSQICLRLCFALVFIVVFFCLFGTTTVTRVRSVTRRAKLHLCLVRVSCQTRSCHSSSFDTSPYTFIWIVYNILIFIVMPALKIMPPKFTNSLKLPSNLNTNYVKCLALNSVDISKPRISTLSKSNLRGHFWCFSINFSKQICSTIFKDMHLQQKFSESCLLKHSCTTRIDCIIDTRRSTWHYRSLLKFVFNLTPVWVFRSVSAVALKVALKRRYFPHLFATRPHSVFK